MSFTLGQRRKIKKIAGSRPAGHDLPFSAFSLAKPAEFLVAEGVVDDISHGRFCQSAGCQRRNAVPWSSTHSASSPYALRSGSSAWPPAARTRSTAAAMSSTR